MAYCLGPSIQPGLPAVDGVFQSEVWQTVEFSQPQRIRDVHANILCNFSPAFEEVWALHQLAPCHGFFPALMKSFSVPSAQGPPYHSQTHSEPLPHQRVSLPLGFIYKGVPGVQVRL